MQHLKICCEYIVLYAGSMETQQKPSNENENGGTIFLVNALDFRAVKWKKEQKCVCAHGNKNNCLRLNTKQRKTLIYLV